MKEKKRKRDLRLKHTNLIKTKAEELVSHK